MIGLRQRKNKMSTKYSCDKCGSEKNVTSAKFLYRADTGMRGNKQFDKHIDLCPPCLKKIIDFMNKKEK